MYQINTNNNQKYTLKFGHARIVYSKLRTDKIY